MKIAHRSIFLFAAAAAITACQQAESPGTTVAEQSLIGDTDPVLSEFPAAHCAMQVTRPNDEDGDPRDPRDCSCVVVGTRIVLTAAECVYDNVPDHINNSGSPFYIDLRTGDTAYASATPHTIAEIELYRYYDDSSPGAHELALILLNEDAGVTPIDMDGFNESPPAEDDALTLVGFGTPLGGFGQAHELTTAIESVSDFYLFSGDIDNTSCSGDGGGPGFLANGKLATINVFHIACRANVRRIRLDQYLDTFIYPYIDAHEGPCKAGDTCVTAVCRTPDPDCGSDDCEWLSGACEEDCPTRDWDCDEGAFTGEACATSGECEEFGTCEEARDDPRGTFCAKACDPAGNDCPADMDCVSDGASGNHCIWLTLSPGSQGFACADATACNSGICEDDICVDECDPNNASSCTLPYLCGASQSATGKDVCLAPQITGGGGFCSSGGPSNLVWLSLALFCAALVVRRRRRSASAAIN